KQGDRHSSIRGPARSQVHVDWGRFRQLKKVMSIRNNILGIRAIFMFDNWPVLLLERLFNRKAGLLIYRTKGMEILMDHLGGDCNGTRACLTTDMYSRYLPHLALHPPIRVLDLGANGGGFLLMLRAAKVEVAQAVCVEMNP